MSATLSDPGNKVLSPSSLAHVVLRTSNFTAMRDFYKTFLGATPAFESDQFSFLTYDEEHHRVAIINMPHLAPKDSTTRGLDHIAFTYPTLDALALAYLQRKENNILPAWPVNHGPTTSIYYWDPDGNTLETQVDNFDTNEETSAYLQSEEFQVNPLGVDFDPDELVKRLQSGESHKSIKKRPASGPRGFDTVPIA